MDEKRIRKQWLTVLFIALAVPWINALIALIGSSGQIPLLDLLARLGSSTLLQAGFSYLFYYRAYKKGKKGLLTFVMLLQAFALIIAPFVWFLTRAFGLEDLLSYGVTIWFLVANLRLLELNDMLSTTYSGSSFHK